MCTLCTKQNTVFCELCADLFRLLWYDHTCKPPNTLYRFCYTQRNTFSKKDSASCLFYRSAKTLPFLAAADFVIAIRKGFRYSK